MKNKIDRCSANADFKTVLPIIAGVFTAAAGAFVYYCEKLQLLPFTAAGRIVRLGIIAVSFGAVFFLIFCLMQKAIQQIAKKEWIPIFLSALVLSVCFMVWFPVPDKGLYKAHNLSVRAVPDENGEMRPLTLTWLNGEGGEISLKSVRCTGNCYSTEKGVTLEDGNAELSWHGIPGNVVTVEFLSDGNQGIAEISWDGNPERKALNNPDMSRLSFDYAFAPSDGLSEFIAVFGLLFLICFAGVLAALKLLPEWNITVFYLSIFVVFIGFRVIQFCSVTSPLTFVDSEFYLGQSRLPMQELLSGEKYCRIEEWHCLSRPLLVPLIYKLCRQDLKTIVVVQLAVSLISWGYFSRFAASLCKIDICKKLVMIFSLGLGCIPNVTRWDQMIMSESLSISAGMLLMGSLFWLTASAKDGAWNIIPAISTAFSALLFAHSRDSAVWTLVLVILLLICILPLRLNKRVLVGLTGILAVICLQVFVSTGDRWVYSYENDLFHRVLTEPQGERFFIDAGMPVSPHLKHFYGAEHVMTDPLFNSKEFEPLREWILSDGLKTYVRYLLRIPFKTLRMTWYEGFEAEAFEKTGYTFTPFGFQQLLPDPVVKLFSCCLPGVLIVMMALTGLVTAFRVPNGERYAFPLLFILSAYLLSTAAFIADEYELDRHIMGIVIMLKASLWPLLLMLGEDLSGKR